MALIANIMSKFDDSGIKKAKSAFGDLKHAITGGIELESLKKVGDFLLDAAKAASKDDKSMLLLNTQLKRNAGANNLQIKQSNKFIERMSLQTGIVKNQLRPAYARFANVTHNVKDAQKLLTIALDASAGSGLSQTRIVKAVSQAFTGNQKALAKLFPELKNNKDALGGLAKEYKGMAELKADPFMKFNNSMDILKEKLGNAILPMITDFVDQISKPGGLVDQVGKFLDDLSNPKTDAGKLFTNLKDAVKGAVDQVKNFFAAFGGGDAMKGFSNVVTGLIKALPALLALKGILVLAETGAALKNLVLAVGLIRGKSPIPTTNPINDVGNSPIGSYLKGLALTQVIGQYFSNLNEQDINSKLKNKGLHVGISAAYGNGSMAIPTANGSDFLGIGNNASTGKITNNNVTIHVHSADPKAVVDAVSQYVKKNGKVPKSWNLVTGNK